jgi:hypothetical protein
VYGRKDTDLNVHALTGEILFRQGGTVFRSAFCGRDNILISITEMHTSHRQKILAFVGSEKSENIFQERKIYWNEDTRQLRLSAPIKKALMKAPKTLWEVKPGSLRHYLEARKTGNGQITGGKRSNGSLCWEPGLHTLPMKLATLSPESSCL